MCNTHDQNFSPHRVLQHATRLFSIPALAELALASCGGCGWSRRGVDAREGTNTSSPSHSMKATGGAGGDGRELTQASCRGYGRHRRGHEHEEGGRCELALTSRVEEGGCGRRGKGADMREEADVSSWEMGCLARAMDDKEKRECERSKQHLFLSNFLLDSGE